MRHRVLPTNFTPHTAQAPAVQAGSFTVKEKNAILYMQQTRATSLKAIKNKLSSKNYFYCSKTKGNNLPRNEYLIKA